MTNDKKIFRVFGALEIEMFVLAKDEAQATEIGKLHWRDEVSNAGLSPYMYDVTEITSPCQVAEETLESMPYGSEGEDSPQVTIAEHLAGRGPFTCGARVKYRSEVLPFLGPTTRLWNGEASKRRGTVVGDTLRNPKTVAVEWDELLWGEGTSIERAHVDEIMLTDDAFAAAARLGTDEEGKP